MSGINKLFNQSIHYVTGHLILMIGGFVSFPILTRIFSVSDYGILGLITSTLFIGAGIMKFGLPSAIVQFYEETKARNQVESFRSTLFFGPLALNAGITAVLVVLTQLIGPNFFDRSLVNLLSLAWGVLFVGCMTDVVTSFLRAEQRTKLFNAVAILRRYGSLGISVLILIYFVRNLYGFYLGQAISGIMVLLLLIYIFCKRQKISVMGFSIKIFREAIKFGIPLIWIELAHLILNYVDRYLIQIYLGSEALGLYTAGYTLTIHAMDVILYPISYTITPIYMELLVNKGVGETQEFFSKSFRYFCLITIPLAFGFIAVGRDLISLLASNKYIEAYPVIPFLVVGQAIYIAQIISNSGLFITKKTHIVSFLMAGACIFKVGLNVIFIPWLGITGAAIGTMITYTAYSVIVSIWSLKVFKFRIDYGYILLYFFLALIMFVVVTNVSMGSHLLTLFGRVAVGIVVYGFLIVVFDRQIRGKVLGLFYVYAKSS